MILRCRYCCGSWSICIYILIEPHWPLFLGELTFHFMGKIFENMGPIWVLGIYIYIHLQVSSKNLGATTTQMDLAIRAGSTNVKREVVSIGFCCQDNIFWDCHPVFHATLFSNIIESWTSCIIISIFKQKTRKKEPTLFQSPKNDQLLSQDILWKVWWEHNLPSAKKSPLFQVSIGCLN